LQINLIGIIICNTFSVQKTCCSIRLLGERDV